MECIHVHRNDDMMILGAIYDNNIIIFTMQSIVRNLFDNARTVFYAEVNEDEHNGDLIIGITQTLLDWTNYDHIIDQPGFVEESHPEFDEPDYGDDDEFGDDDVESSITFDADGNVIAVSHNGDCIYFI